MSVGPIVLLYLGCLPPMFLPELGMALVVARLFLLSRGTIRLFRVRNSPPQRKLLSWTVFVQVHLCNEVSFAEL